MNIFAVEGDETTGEVDWYKSGRSLDNLRTVKMILESAQLLSTAMHINGMQGCYKPTHAKHPSTLWTAESFDNWKQLVEHAEGLMDEYTERFGKVHACKAKIDQMVLDVDGSKFPSQTPTPLRIAMPDEFKSSNPVKSYRDYYSTKENIRYPAGKVPDWFLARRTKVFKIVE